MSELPSVKEQTLGPPREREKGVEGERGEKKREKKTKTKEKKQKEKKTNVSTSTICFDTIDTTI